MSLKDCRDKDGNLIAYAFPGGYQMLYLDANNDELCPDCAQKADSARRYLKAYDADSYAALVARLGDREKTIARVRTVTNYTRESYAVREYVARTLDGQRAWLLELQALRDEVAKIAAELAVAKENESDSLPVYGFIFEEGAAVNCSACNALIESVYGDPTEDDEVEVGE